MDLGSWLSEGLSEILDFEVPQEMIQYVMSIHSKSDLEEYMKTLLDFDNPQHKDFFEEVLKRKFFKESSLPRQQKKKIAKSNKPEQEFVSIEKPPTETSEKENSKKKTKFVNLYSKEGENAQVVLLKGRHHCDCEASKHDLINNCTECGRIVCKQEGSGPCLFCGALVCTPEEERELMANTKGGAKLRGQLMERGRPNGWEAAVATRDRLLQYDKTNASNRVTDDDCDYFQTGSVWLNPKEREQLEQYQQKLQEAKHASRREKKMTFDFAGRQIIEDNTVEQVDLDKINDIISGGSKRRIDDYFYDADSNPQLALIGDDREVAPGVNPGLLKLNPDIENRIELGPIKSRSNLGFSKIQDAEIQELSDTGRCLSMHQPWASLLVEGIKLHEGRTWYTNHRGRLWIASTAKPPDPSVVKAIENQYRVLYPERSVKFPSFYPTGCLLGCVHVDDCLPQEEYIKKYPNGESDSPYVFICSNPVSLRLRFPIKGQHKIYSLDKAIHTAALKCLQTMAKMDSA